MALNSHSIPELFKGIALFTPGGDLIYCIDPSKQDQWHLNLCVALQDLLGLPEPPHFLIPGYTATLDHWRDPRTQQIQTSAQVYPAVQRYQALLNAIFATEHLIWETAPWQEESCNPILLETYHASFPQLWESHDLIVQVGGKDRIGSSLAQRAEDEQKTQHLGSDRSVGYVLRLFVSGHHTATKQTLEMIHQLLEQGLRHPYTLKVIDISQHPEEAEINHVTAIPTLVRVWPKPVKRIVGELSDSTRVLQIIAGN
ncbi:circadian clock protein KaiB [Aphanothece hegewaldii CCALA 016]|uniref:Circadian clock protein KaiB n=1 Tax=Aphanothece hegewaldii CCALA 016 TaxID=2107694 RepID=A0A2T1LST5_9CHRO|nr:circadian clock KaiB family protein [Aphanothece hegewaldii]PSF33115.1 circadian clock protein KaiB [Aphanothece hegewaldii CCALA 016]